MKSLAISRLALSVWNMLTETHEVSASQIERDLNINEDELFTAIGWLAHDKKIFLSKLENDEWYISNKQPRFFFTL